MDLCHTVIFTKHCTLHEIRPLKMFQAKENLLFGPVKLDCEPYVLAVVSDEHFSNETVYHDLKVTLTLAICDELENANLLENKSSLEGLLHLQEITPLLFDSLEKLKLEAISLSTKDGFLKIQFLIKKHSHLKEVIGAFVGLNSVLFCLLFIRGLKSRATHVELSPEKELNQELLTLFQSIFKQCS